MFDSVRDNGTTIFREDRPIVIGWLKDHPEFHASPQFSVYLSDEFRRLSVEEYLKGYSKRS